MPFNCSRSLEFQFHLYGNRPRTAVATRSHAEQASRWRCRISEGSKSSLRGGFSRNAGQHHARKAKVGMIGNIEELGFQPHGEFFTKSDSLRQIHIGP
jgi:hypothetical protein